MAVDEDEKKILSVSQLTAEIKGLLETQVGEVWVKGEVSNLKIPASGHAYFTLKDENSQISAVLFRGRAKSLRFDLEDGMEVVAFGKISLYEPRGSYQIIVDFLEPAGLGALQAAFEKLKKKLSEEGLFEEERKRALPYLPQRIGVVTSATGAAIRDLIQVLGRRHPRLQILLAPAKVQGEGAAEEIAARIHDLNVYSQSQEPDRALDLMIVGRGGGSLEDLWAFNEEVVARAIFSSKIPVISAVGHEIDFTIADFVADVRAPTPSAAAEVAVPVLSELEDFLHTLHEDLRSSVLGRIKEERSELKRLCAHLVRPDRRLVDLRLRLDDWNQRLVYSLKNAQEQKRKDFQNIWQILLRTSPIIRMETLRTQILHLYQSNGRSLEKTLTQKRNQLEKKLESLHALSPLNILSRGYSVVRGQGKQKVLHRTKDFKAGQKVEIIVTDGRVAAEVIQPDLRATDALTKKPKSKKQKSNPQGQFWG